MKLTVAKLGSGTNGSDSSCAQTALGCVAKTTSTDYAFAAVLKDGCGYRHGYRGDEQCADGVDWS